MVFEPHRYLYAGRVEAAGPVREERQLDDEGRPRRVYVFPVRLAGAGVQPVPRVEDLGRIRRQRGRLLGGLDDDELRRRAASAGSERPGRREALTTQYERNEAVAALAKRLASGRCDLCGGPAPFSTVEGPYLECPHIVHLAKGGPDTIGNTVALCPNCHRKMHALDLEVDRRKLLDRVQRRDCHQEPAEAFLLR